MTSLTYQSAMEVNPALREQLGRQIQEMQSETQSVSFLERLLQFWAGLYATPTPAPRHYL
jgi:hypothetical protein